MTAENNALRLVPVEPTEAMILAGEKAAWDDQNMMPTIRAMPKAYAAMLAAAPAVQPAAGRDEMERLRALQAELEAEAVRFGTLLSYASFGRKGCEQLASDLRAILAAISTPAQASEPIVHIQCETRSEGVIGTTNLDVVRVEQNDDGSFTVVTDHWPAQASGEAEQ